ncbi:translation initiation factor eIF3 subunit [Ascodesmis nigricans]|uniref:Eukaryotic translation initiation factor 3 subunit J n=1 Tax=Ascodesmis nigricans TaxID=341454 RepID=A0A4S2N8M7_9PEZI|nr:translation initiation factor eIF3 subunit [Ascodesmis nigricans]
MAPPKKFDDEDESSDEEPRVPIAAARGKKWDDEESDDDVLDSWDAADDSEDERKKAKAAELAAQKAAEVAANKKSKAERIEEHKAIKAAAAAAAEAEKNKYANETEAERRARVEAQQVESDLAHAEDLFGNVGIGAGSGGTQRTKPIAIVDPTDPTRSIDLAAMQIFKPTTKANFDQLRDVLVPLLTANKKKPHYAIFLQDFTRAIAKDLSSEQIRKVASNLTALSNEKQKEEKAAEKGGKKKGKAAGKVALVGATKTADKHDTTNYADSNYDDFDDFM